MSSPITLSGFNNIDFGQVLNALMAQERLPVSQLETQQTALTNQKTFFATFASKLAGLESAVDALTSATAFDVTDTSPSPPWAMTASVIQSSPLSTAKPVGRFASSPWICFRSPLDSLMPRILGCAASSTTVSGRTSRLTLFSATSP